MSVILEAIGLSFGYDYKETLHELSFKIGQGEICVLLGANGAGKSTLLKILAGVLKFKKGSLKLREVDSRDISSKTYASQVSYVAQNIVFESSTVIDAVLIGRLPLFTAPSKNDYIKVYEMIDKLDLAPLAMKDVLKLSGGEKQKVAIARALSSDSDIILMDEPTANLDIKNRYEIIGIIKNSAKKGKSVVVTMHDVNEALDLADHFIVLDHGRIVADGDNKILDEQLIKNVYGLSMHKVEHDGKIHFHIKEEDI